MEKVKAILILLYERPWERSELLTIAAGLFVFLLLLVARRRRKARGRIVYADHVPEATTAIGTKLAGANQSGKRLNKSRKGRPAHARETQGNRRKWSMAAERPEGSVDPVRQLRLQCEIVKRDQTKPRLEHEVAELRIAGEQVRQESAHCKQIEERLKEQPAEATAAKEQLQSEFDENKQAEEKLRKWSTAVEKPEGSDDPVRQLLLQCKNIKREVVELKVAGEQVRQESAQSKQVKERLKEQAAEATPAKEQLQRELAESRQAEENLKLKVGELTVANEQLRQEAAERQKAGRSGKDTRYEDYHRVADGAEQKLCRKCDEWKARSEFHKNASSKDGLATWCKVCKTKAARESRQRRTAPKD